MVKTKTEGNSVESYQYDTQNRISKLTVSFPSSPSEDFYNTFTYYKDTLYVFSSNYSRQSFNDTLPDGTPIVRQYNGILVLNSHGLFEGTYNNKNFNIIIDGPDYSYHYDANDFLQTYINSITDAYTKDSLFNNGTDYTEKRGVFIGFAGEFSVHTTYQYFADKVNTLGNKNFGKIHLGKSSTHLLKQEYTTYKHQTLGGIDYAETKNYTYEFDNLDRVIKRTTETILDSVSGSDTTYSTATYTYY
ncbi:MAG: hypothetical protein U0T77_02525 [Chitinophagales bacterium]